MQFGIREVWVIHPTARVDLMQTVRTSFRQALVPFYIGSAFDSNTFRNLTTSQLEEIAKYTPDDFKWSFAEHYKFLQGNASLQDSFGGWQAHLLCWKRISLFAKWTKIDLPVIVLEDDLVPRPMFLTQISKALRSIQTDWAVLSLSSAKRSSSCRHHICKSPSTHFGSAYVIRNGSVAQELFLANNRDGPTFTQTGRKRGAWIPQIGTDYHLYSMKMTELKQISKQSAYQHSSRFSPV